ncbi:hypothetical protein Thermo_01488 [Thermoplasmatales archaeon]|nr:hypothetical protein Thermo_01488 [Thermoplasmatales archaeon]
MYNSRRKYSGLDDFFKTSSTNSLSGWKAIEERIGQIDDLYSPWEFDIWNFTKIHEETQFLVNEIYESIEIIESSAVEYIIGDFNSSIAASSSAVEKICNVILYLDFLNDPDPKQFTSIDSSWTGVDTVYGMRYFDKRWNRLVQKGPSLWVLFKHESLSDTLLKKVECLGYSCKTLLNEKDTFEHCVFISRRNAAAHGDFSRITIVEQLHGYVLDDDPNTLLKLTTNKDACLDQYKKASEFTKEVIKRFGQLYPQPTP